MIWLIALVMLISGCDGKPVSVNLNVSKTGATVEKDKYVIYANPKDTSMILLDKITGRSWRYFRTIDKDGNISDEGWQFLMYNAGGYEGVTPEIAVSNMNEAIKKSLNSNK